MNHDGLKENSKTRLSDIKEIVKDWRNEESKSNKVWRKSDKIKYWLKSIFRDNYALILYLSHSVSWCLGCILAALWRQQRQTLFWNELVRRHRKRISFALKRVLKLYGVFICCHSQTHSIYEFSTLLLSNRCDSMGICLWFDFMWLGTLHLEFACEKRKIWIICRLPFSACQPNYNSTFIRTHDIKQWKRIKPN